MQVTLEVPEDSFHQYISKPLVDLYTVGVNPAMFERLHAFRQGVIDTALSQHLLKMAKADLRQELKTIAERSVLAEMEDAFWKEATMPPLRLKAISEDVRSAVCLA
jgi:hypothetical protein